jgi:hypothetical protein
VWAVAVLLFRNGRDAVVRTALVAVAVYFVMFALGFPDGDLAQRLALAPGLLLIVLAVNQTVEEGGLRSWFGIALVPVLLLSSLQLARSAALYLMRS